jgi:hypothetical protein
MPAAAPRAAVAAAPPVAAPTAKTAHAAATPTVLAAAPATVATTPTKPAPAARAVATPAPALPATAHNAATPAAHGPQIQFAAVTSEQAAQAEWDRIARKMPSLLGGRKPAFSKVEHDGKTFWRVRTAGFADLAAAKGLCDQVKSKGGTCTVSAS